MITIGSHDNNRVPYHKQIFSGHVRCPLPERADIRSDTRGAVLECTVFCSTEPLTAIERTGELKTMSKPSALRCCEKGKEVPYPASSDSASSCPRWTIRCPLYGWRETVLLQMEETTLFLSQRSHCSNVSCDVSFPRVRHAIEANLKRVRSLLLREENPKIKTELLRCRLIRL